MDDRNYYIRISPEVILGDIKKVPYFVGQLTTYQDYQVCCKTYKMPIISNVSGETYVYSSMTALLSGATGTNDKGIDVTKNVSKATHKLGTSLLTGMTIPILLTENTVDLGYYSVFDGMVVQKDVMTNFIFSASPVSAMTVYFYNTSDTEFKKYLEFSEYKLDWGDPGMPGVITLSPSTIFPLSHPYSQPSPPSGYTISLSGMSPWGSNVVKKTVHVPYTSARPVNNPKGTINGTAYFTPSGGNWSGASFMYDFIFSGDTDCHTTVDTIGQFTTVPFLITGYTQSTLNDLKQYGSTPFPTNSSLTGVSGSYGSYYGVKTSDGVSYSSYTVNDINYHDFSDGTTIFLVQSSGLTSDMVVCSAITKNEVLLNVIDEAEVQSNVFVERGKQSSLESLERLGEVDNIGDLTKYGYKFFNIIKT
jgi:hypothetical protein